MTDFYGDIELRTCSRCKEVLPSTLFHVDSRYCKDCRSEYNRMLRHAKKEPLTANQRRAVRALKRIYGKNWRRGVDALIKRHNKLRGHDQ